MNSHANHEVQWNTGTSEGFYSYYEQQSGSAAARRRFEAIHDTLMRAMGHPRAPLSVADVGCGAGTQCRVWAERGHDVRGADINEPLIWLARKRAADAGHRIRFDVASATALPWADAAVDVCIAPELLEHVADWQGCLAELVRVLKPGGVLYLSTSNKLCPSQEEFTLPLYSWYPGFVKRRFERLARTTRPELAAYATYPAVNWFSYYGLAAHLRKLGLACSDRFDMIDVARHGKAARTLVRMIRALPPLRFCAHVATPYTAVLAVKRRA